FRGKPAMGYRYIYFEIDSAKEKIKDAFQGVEASYKPLWDIIDTRWDNPNFKVEYNVKKDFMIIVWIYLWEILHSLPLLIANLRILR
ncbi:hypothetical protein S83_071360, partial [Arachis hypogaea]